MNYQNKNERGSAIIWILIAVGLFAALNFAFNSSSRTSTSVLDDAEAGAYAKEIIQYGNELKAAVQRMKLLGVEETEFSFGQTVNTPGNAPGHNLNCTINKCEVFNPQGGQLTAKALDNGGQARTIAVDGVGTTDADLVFTIYTVGSGVCLRINEFLGVGTPGTLPVLDTFDAGTYDGSYGVLANPLGEIETSFSGKHAFCSEANSNGNYHFHQVLIAR